jgi:quercetin dioxygenase-like cupin family protein
LTHRGNLHPIAGRQRAERREDLLLRRMVFGAALAVFAAALCSAPVMAQQAGPTPGVKRTILETHDVPGTGYQSVLGIAEVGPNVKVARHTHPGPEISYVLAGSLTLEVDGQPQRSVAAGQSIFVPAGTPHGGSAGPAGAKILANWIVEKGKPLASPAK